MARAAVILAAGQGTRMKSAKPKVMHPIAGLPILGHVIAAARGAGAERIVVVIAPGAVDVEAFVLHQGIETVVQDKQLGTGHAAACAASVLKNFAGTLVVTYGDHPLFTSATFEASFAAQEKSGMAIVTFHSTSTTYGRVITKPDGLLDRIVEYRDANAAERKVDLCNAGIMAANAKSFFRWASELKNNNSQKEYYLTDIPTIAKADGIGCAVVTVDEAETMGVNSRAELAVAEAAMQERLRARALDAGVGMTAPQTVFLSHDTVLEADFRSGPMLCSVPASRFAAAPKSGRSRISKARTSRMEPSSDPMRDCVQAHGSARTPISATSSR